MGWNTASNITFALTHFASCSVSRKSDLPRLKINRIGINSVGNQKRNQSSAILTLFIHYQFAPQSAVLFV
jgi:hypothetical protein